MTANIETEFKFRTERKLEAATADAAIAESAFDCSLATSHRHNDTYLDDAWRSLAASGIGLRVRVTRGASTVTCKRRTRRNGALFVREEYEAPWPQPTTPPTAADLPAPLRDVVEPFLLRRPLVPVIRLDVTRDLRRLCRDGAELCELAIDFVEAHGAGRTVRFSEVEIEVADDPQRCEELAEYLGRELDVKAARNDKPTHAASLLGMVGQAGWAETPAVVASTPTTTAITRILHRQLAAVQQAEVCVRQSRGIEPIHEMRTTLRRLRSLVSAFRDLWPPDEATLMRAHLRALGTELGRVRDLDVMTARIASAVTELAPELRPGAERLVDWLTAQRLESHDSMVNWLRSPGRLDDARRFTDLAAVFTASADEQPIANTARDRLANHVSRLRRRIKPLNEDSPIAGYHQARVAAKHLRYLLEEFGGIASIPTAKVTKRLERMQEVLGRLCDADVATRQLLEWTPKVLEDHPDDPLVGPAIGALIQLLFTEIGVMRSNALERAQRERARLDLPN